MNARQTQTKHYNSTHQKQSKNHSEMKVNSDEGKRDKFFCDQYDFIAHQRKVLKSTPHQGMKNRTQ